MSERFPVWLSVTREDGRTEQVRVGTAVKTVDGFTLAFDAMKIGNAPVEAVPARAAGPTSSRGGGAPAGMLLPNYGRSKGQPVRGASASDLEFYANGARRSLGDPSKARWHDKERELLSAIEAEMARQRGDAPSSSDDEIPPPSDDDAPF